MKLYVCVNVYVHVRVYLYVSGERERERERKRERDQVFRTGRYRIPGHKDWIEKLSNEPGAYVSESLTRAFQTYSCRSYSLPSLSIVVYEA